MLFNSFDFLIFLPIVLALYHALPSWKAQNGLLLAAGYLFYGWWNPWFLLLLMFSTTVDYWLALRIDAQPVGSPARKQWLVGSLIVNLGILGFFKYFNFFIDSAARVLDLFHLEAHAPLLRIALPVGVSFYTFQSMSYTIDTYRGRIRPTQSLFQYATFVGYFPQLVAGPIERATAILPAFSRPRPVTARDIADGLGLMVLGYFKKLVIADATAGLVMPAFADPTQADGSDMLRAVYLFAIQIYGDFSGYSDIARGVSRLFGIELMVNFNQPYLSTSITEFWRRWHISLSTWLRDYLYIPLGGSRNGTLATYRNNFLTMLLGGLWHGANWTYVVWGALHGIYLAIHKFWMGRAGLREPPRPSRLVQLPLYLLKGVATFHLVCLAWVFFRAPTFDVAWLVLGRIFSPWHNLSPSVFALPALYAMMVLALDLPQYVTRDHLAIERLRWPARTAIYGALLLLIFLLGGANSATFIYFQF